MDTTVEQVLHLRLDGASYEHALDEMGLTMQSTDSEVKDAVGRRYDRPPTALSNYVVVRERESVIVRPAAVYG
jgi:hypothetical protein